MLVCLKTNVRGSSLSIISSCSNVYGLSLNILTSVELLTFHANVSFTGRAGCCKLCSRCQCLQAFLQLVQGCIFCLCPSLFSRTYTVSSSGPFGLAGH